MDISSDHLRREAADIQVEHRRAMIRMREAVRRVFGGDRPISTQAKRDFAIDGINRRRFIQIGGVTIASAAVLAACSDSDDDDSSGGGDGGGDGNGDGAQGSDTDITILRTASSLEELAVAVYQTAIDSGLVTTMAVVDAAMLFQSQHQEHAALFEGATEDAGGQSFTEPNPVVMEQLQPAIDALTDETGVVQLAYDLENVAAQTYQSAVGAFSDASFNVATMSVGGVEARHAAVLAQVLSQPAVPVAFQVTDNAVMVGTGV
jgi:hypothetical protein